MLPKNIPLLAAAGFLALMLFASLFLDAGSGSSPNSKDRGGVSNGVLIDGKSKSSALRDAKPEGAGGVLSSILPSAWVKKNVESPQIFGTDGSVKIEQVPRGRLRRELLDLDEHARQSALNKLGESKVPVLDVNSLHVSKDGSLYYTCQSLTVAPEPLPPEATAPSQSKVPISSPPACSSRPGSQNTIYLNFSGFIISGKAWNTAEFPIYEALPYDLDGDRTTFNQYEQAQIVEMWRRVSEDFKPFDINVTTVMPSDLETNPRISHALITKNMDAKGRPMPSASAGGVAYLGAFGGNNANYLAPALCYYNQSGVVAHMVTTTISHEVGHNLNLSHDGLTGGGAQNEYYGGHGKDQQSWGPIMGAPYRKNFTQWTTGNLSYYKANNTENDLAVIAGCLSVNGSTGYIADDVSTTIGNATTITPAAGQFSTQEFLIGAGGDVDVHKIVVDASYLQATISSFKIPNSQASGSNLGIKAEILSSNGSVLAINDSGQNTVKVAAVVDPGICYIRISGTGCGNSINSNPTGFKADGSMGTYFITGSISGAPLDGNAAASTALSSLSVSAGTLVPSPSYRYKVTGNSSIAAGQNATLNFEASPANAGATLFSLAVQPTPVPTPTPVPGASPTPTPIPQADPLTVTHSITRSWGSGMQGQLLLKNTTKASIPTWSLNFEYPSAISSFSGATFSKEVISREFTASVPNETDSIMFNWTTANQSATSRVSLNSGNFTSYNGTGNFSLSPGENTIMLEVTSAGNATIKGYHRLTITRQTGLALADTGTKLSAISFGVGTWTPAFSANNSSYALSIPNANSTISINATKLVTGGKIEARVGAGAFFPLVSGRPSALITLPVGESTIETKVTSANGTSSSYFFTLNRNGSNPTLSSLLARWNGFNLAASPSFSSNTTSYNATVANSVSLITVTPTTTEKNSSVSVRIGSGNFTSVASGSSSAPLALVANATSTVQVRVLSDDNTNSTTYSLNLARLAAPSTSPIGTISLNGTTLNGTIDARSSSSAFQIGTTSAFGTSLPVSFVGGNGTVAVSTVTSTLLPSTLYYYRLTSQYNGIMDYGNTATFVTPISAFSANISQVLLTGANATGFIGAAFSDFSSPAINNNSRLAFLGYLSYGVAGSKIFGGVWTGNNRTTSLSAGIGASAPDNAIFSGIGEPILDDSGRMTFVGFLKIGFAAVTASKSAGVWQAASNGTISKIARAGENAPGATGAVFSQFNKLVAGNGGVAFTATLASANSTSNEANNMGLWAQSSAGDLILVARTGASPTPTLRSFTIFNAEPGQNAQSRHFNNSGDLLLTASFGNGTTGIYRATKSANFTLNSTAPVVAVGSAVPGVTGANFTSLGNPIINNTGDIAFRATFSGNGVSSGNNTGIFRFSSNGTGALIVRTGVALGNQTFQSLSSPLLNNANDIAFTGGLATGGNITESNANGIWTISSNGTLTKIFRSGDSSPGVVGATFASFSQLAFPANGGIIFAATLATGSEVVSANNNQGLWTASSVGANPNLIVRTGNSLSVGSEVKTIFSFDFVSASLVTDGVGRSINADGDVIMKLNFLDKSSGLFRCATLKNP